MTDNMQLFQHLMRVSHLLRHGHGEPELKVAPGQRRVLTALGRSGPKTQQELLKELGISPATLSETLGKLEEKHLVERSRSPEDKRRTIVALTEAGSDEARGIDSTSEKIADEVFDVLDEADKVQLDCTLQRLLDNWNRTQAL